MIFFQHVALTFVMAKFASGVSFIDDVDNASLSSDRNDNADMTSDEEDRIYGGFDARISKYPFVARLLYHPDATEPNCNGILVAPRYVLTSAECLEGFIPGLHASFGTSRKNETIAIVEAFEHPKYDFPRSNTYNVALFKLEKPSSYKPARLADANESGDKAGTRGIVVGWGMVSENDFAKTLQAVEVEILPDEDCEKYTDDTDFTFCSEKRQGKGPCTGDWGAPLISKGVVVGMASNIDGLEADCPELPAVYTRISKVLDYVADITSGGSTGNVTKEYQEEAKKLWVPVEEAARNYSYQDISKVP